MRVKTISKVVNKYLSADWAAGVGWRVPKRCPLSVGVHPRAGVKRTRASVRRVRLNSDCGSRQVVCETNFFPVLPNEGPMLPNAAWWGGAVWLMVENGVLECARAEERGCESRQPFLSGKMAAPGSARQRVAVASVGERFGAKKRGYGCRDARELASGFADE